MIMEWFNGSEATRIGVSLADQYSKRVAVLKKPGISEVAEELAGILSQFDGEVRSLQLNFYKRAKLGNAFKWRLLENGVEQGLVEDATQRLLIHLSVDRSSTEPAKCTPERPPTKNVKELLAFGNQQMMRGAYAEAIETYEQLILIDPRHATAFNNLGAALCGLGRMKEAEGYFYQAMKIEPDYPDAHSNIGNALFLAGKHAAAEVYLRRAIKLNPRLVQARINLGLALSASNHLPEATRQLQKALKIEPGNADALAGLAVIASTKGDFELAAEHLASALRSNPKMPKALALQAGLRKMTIADDAWLRSASEVADSLILPLDESELRFGIAKFYDDIGNFKLAFQNYKRANDLLKSVAEPYVRETYASFVDLVIRTYPPAVVRSFKGKASDSIKPVFVVGMPRSGTSLAEQIISSHPLAKGAGELGFWADVIHEHQARVKEWLPDESTRKKLAGDYLHLLHNSCGDAMRIVDKAPVNSDYLGLIHSVFPNARIIYMKRDPIDTCLSCYFQKFILSLNFTMDLSDLASYYLEHHRLMTHWRNVLPAGTLLDVPYEGLVTDQAGWSRKILEFLDLEWDERVLKFHETNRAVATASFWQVKQKLYNHSVQRWRNYEKFIGPLKTLKDVSG